MTLLPGERLELLALGDMIEERMNAHRHEALGIGQSFDDLADALRSRPAPYPWCYGAPTKAACIEAGYCRRNPTCGD